MSEDTDVAPQKLPRYSTNIPYNRKSSDKNVESFAINNGGPGASVLGSISHNMNQTNPTDRPGEDRSMAGNKSNMPHVSRSRAFRESFNSGGYSVFKDFDSNNTPMYEITPISAGDFKLSDDTTNPIPQNEVRKPTLTETIVNLGIDTLPASDASRRDNLSTALNGFEFNREPNNNEVADDSWYADTRQDTPGTSNSRQKQRARSEPAGARKVMTLSEEFSENIMKSFRSPGAGPEIKALENSSSPLKLIDGSTIYDQPGRFRESEPVEKPNVYLHTLDSQVISVSDGRQKPKGKRKRQKPRNPECFIPILTANTDNNMQKGSSPEKNSIFLGDNHLRSLSSPRGAKLNDSNVDKSTLQSPKKSSPKRDSIGTSPKSKPSPRNTCSPKGKPQQDPVNITSLPNVTGSGHGEGSPSSPKARQDPSRSRSQDSPKGKRDSKSPPYNEKSCEIKFPQQCHRRSRFCGRCYRPSLQGNLFRNIAQAFGCQLTCIATCNQRFQGFPGMQGLYTPEVEVESLFNQQPYVVCEEWQEERTPAMKEVRSAPRRHGTPAFYSNRRHSSESFRYRGSKGFETRQRGVSQQAQQSRRVVSASERRYQSYGSDYPTQDDRQLRFELKQTSQSSLTSVGDNYESSQSTEPPDEHSLAESRHSGSKLRGHHGGERMFGSEIRMQRSGTESEKKSTGNVSPRSLVSEDNDHSIASRKSARSTERRSKHDIKQSRRSSEVSQHLDIIPRGQASFQSKKEISSGSEDRLQTDSGESVTTSERQFIDRTRQVLEESFKGPYICSRRYPTSERVLENDDMRIKKIIQYEDVKLSGQYTREEVKEKKRSATPDDELSIAERKPVAGRRTPIFERRVHRTHIRDKSQECVLEASRPPVFKVECKYVEEKTHGGDQHRDDYSVGDRMMDERMRLFSDPRSEIQSSINTNVQVYTALCPHGNAPLNVEDCAQARSFSGKEDFKDNEKMATLQGDWSTEPDLDHRLRQSSDSKRCDLREPRMEEINSNIPLEAMSRGAYSDISRSNLAGRRSSGEVPHHDILFIQTTPERCSYGRSGSGHLRLSDDRLSELEHRKPSQASTYERNRDMRRDDRRSSQEESKPEVYKSIEREKKRTASDQEFSHIRGNVKNSHEYRSRQNQPLTEREIHSSFEGRSGRHDSEVEAARRPAVSTDSGCWRELNVQRPVNGTSSKPPSVPPTDCSSEELAIASCVDGQDVSARKLLRRSKECHEDDLSATQGADKPPYSSKRQSGPGYRDGSESRPAEEGCPERGSSSKKVRDQCPSKTVEYSCTESPDDVNSRKVTENQERSSIDSKHSVQHRQLKRDYDSAYDDDMDDGVSQEDASTSISRQLPVDGGLQENYYEYSSQRHEYEDTSSLRERTKRNMHFGEVVERKCHSERLSARSASFKYEASKRKEGKHGNLENASSAKQKGKTSEVRVKSTSSRSSHTLNSREEGEVRVREASARDSLVTMRENKRGRGCGEFRHKQGKPYSSADTRSNTFETGNESQDDEDSENTLPASPGDLESEYLDEETEDRARCGKYRTNRGGTADPDLRKLHGRIPQGRQDSQDESHNSSSCRSTSLEAYWEKLRNISSPIATGKFVGTDEGVKTYLDFFASKSTVAAERESQSCEQVHSDSCMERRCVDTRSARNRHRTYCEGKSGVSQTNKHKVQEGYVHPRSQIRTRSPKFQYYRKKSPLKVEDDDEEEEGNDDDDDDDDESEDDTVTNKTRSHSNSARYGHRSRRCREGTIDLFEQIIIPEQPLQVDEYHHMHSFKNTVPFFCESLKVTTEHPDSRKDCAPQSELSKSVIFPSPVDVHGLQKNGPTQMYSRVWKSHLSSHTESLEISPAETTNPVSSGQHSMMHLKSLLLQSGKEKIQIYSQRRAETQSGTTCVRQADKISRKAEFDVPKDASSSFSSECANIDSEPEAEFVITTGDDAPTEENKDDLVLSCNVLSWGGNKNFSSNAERDRNSSSGNGDSWYPEYAYRCGVIDTLRILDSDLAMSTPTGEFIHPCQKMENTSESCMRHHEIEDHLTYIMQSFPSLALCKQNDETFEIIRQNSLRALVYAAKLSVDWPPANFYDKNEGNLENWIREVKDYSSSSNVSSLTEMYNFDVQAGSEKLRTAHTVANNKQKCSVKGKSLKCSIYQSPSPLQPKVLFRDVRIDKDNTSSPDHIFGDTVQNSGSEQLDDSVALTEHEGVTAERKGTELEHSETTTYLSDSDSHVYTVQGSNSDVTLSADHSSHELEQRENNQHANKYLCKKKNSRDPNNEEGVITMIADKGPNTDLKNRDSWRVRLHKAQLSPIEEDRLRSAISRKLGSQQSFALIPVSFSNSLMSTVQSVCDRSKQSREKSSDLASSCVVTQGRNVSDKDIQDIFDDICDTHLISQQNTMAFYVVAVDKQRSVDDEMRSDVKMGGEQSHATSCTSDGDGNHKKYFIYTKEELVKAVANSFWEKCDLVKPTELSQLQNLQTIEDTTPKHPDRGSGGNRKHEARTVQSIIQRSPQSMDKHNEELAKEAYEILPSPQGDCQAAGRDFTGVKNHNYIYHTSRDQYFTKEQMKQNSQKSQTLEKQDKCECGNFTFKVSNSDATSPSCSTNTPEHAKKSKEITNDYSVNLIKKYKHKLEKSPTRETRDRGASESVSHQLTAQNEDTSCGCQSKERNALGNDPVLEKRHRSQAKKYTKDAETSEVLFQNHPGNLSYNDQAENYRYSEQEECKGLTNNVKICLESGNVNNRKLKHNSKPYERLESCLKQTNNLVHEDSATNKCSSSTSASTSTKQCRKSKSFSDLDVSKVPDLENDDCEKEKKKQKILSQHKTLSLLETLVDGQLIAFFNNALKKITSPKHTICLRIARDGCKVRGAISNPDSQASKKYCNSTLSSEEDQCMTSPSAVSATETMTENSLTEESVVILTLPAESRDRRKRRTRMSPVMKRQNKDALQEWVSNSTPDISRLKSKCDKHTEKYVLSAKRKRLVYKGRGRYRYKRRANIEVQSSESGNITNSANDGNESEASDIRSHSSPSRSRSDCTHAGRNKRLRKRRRPDADNNHSPRRRTSGTASQSRHRRNSRKPVARSETRCRSSSRPLPATRGKRIKNGSLDSRKKNRSKEKPSHKGSSSAKFVIMRNEEKLVEVNAGKVRKEKQDISAPLLTKNTKTFATSGISRIARALNGCHLKERKNLNTDELRAEGRSKHPAPIKTEGRKHVIKRNDNGTPEKGEVRIPFSDEDSLAGCEPCESSLLTPIKEESHSHDYTGSEKSKSDFETFVSKCRTKLMGATSETPHCIHEHSEGCGRRKNNCTMSCSNFSCLGSSTSSDNRCSQEEAHSFESQRKYSRQRLREWHCPYHESDYDHDIGGKVTRNIPRSREYSFSYFQYVVPYKSAFLRQQMQEFVHEEAPVCKKEDELLKTYATGSSRGEYINSARGNLTIPWAVRQTNVNLNWRKPEVYRAMSETDNPIYTRSVPGVSCTKTRAPSVSLSQTRTLSSLYSPYRPGHFCNVSPQVSDYADIPGLGVRSRHLVSGDQARCSKYSSNHWFHSGNADYHELVHRNWNESANNGSDGSSSGDISANEEIDIGDCDQHGEYLKRGHMKGKIQAGDTAAGANDRVGVDKASKESRIGPGKQNHYIKQNHTTSLADPHCLCRDRGCMSYDFIHQNYPVARVSNFAARNINGSGNMFGRGLNPSDERLSAMQEHDADSDEEFNSATEELPHYSSSCRKRPKYGRKGQEIDDTCNHPESMSYYMGDGPSGQYDNFEDLPKEDLLINLSPMNADDDIIYCSHHQKNAACQRALTTEASGQASAGGNKQGRNDCDMQGPAGLGHQLDKNAALAGRSCYGQGDILNKRMFTQWYVDEGEKAQQSQRRPLVSVAQAEKCSHRERWITPSQQCDSSGDDGEEEDDDDEDNDCEDDDDDAEENEDDEEVGEDDEDEDDDEDDEDDDENEDDDEEEDDEDENPDTPEQNLCEDERNLQEKPRGLDHMKEKNAQNNYHHEKPQDINESKIVGHRIVETEQLTKRPTRVRTLTHTKRYAMGNKPGHQQSTGDHLSKPKPAGIHEKNMHIKPTSGHQHKFSLEQIKVPAIEKERVRFACDENGDWAEIGRGSYGCVYLGLLDGVVEVAIKDFYESSSWDLVIHEARMLMFLQDTGITPKFYGLRRRFDVSKQPSEYCIIMEYFGDGRTLFNVMSDKMVLAGDEWMDIVGQLVAGLRLIHRKNVLINDLKADNILIDLTGGRKIIRYIDVGMATYKQGLTFQLPQDQMSKYNFLAPEVREGSRTTTRSDIYSLGYMLEQMCRMADSTLGGLRKLVARCMEKNPARRPDIDDIVSQVHRFIASKASIMINSSSPREQFVLTNSV